MLRRAALAFTVSVVVLAASSPAALSDFGSRDARCERICVKRAYERASDLRFARNSVWRRRIGRKAAVRADSQARVARLAAYLERVAARPLFSAIGYASYSTPVYIVPTRQPRVRVRLDSANRALGRVLARGVPLPSWARPAKGTDGHLTVYQPGTDRMWELWRAQRQADGWHARSGGAMRRVSRSPGYFTNKSWPHLRGSQGYGWGATATSLPVAGGLITIRDLKRGRADHALAAAVPFACEDFFLFPAQRTDGRKSGLDCIPQGARLRLDPRIDVTKLGLPRITRIVARAAQRYGLLVRDQTNGQAVALYAEQVPAGKANPYVGKNGLFGGVPTFRTLRSFPWRRLQIMDARACTRAPCRG